jgi:hypothetical protein
VAADLQHGMERTVLFEIEYLRTCPGVDVSVLSVYPGEKEVLFAPCTGLSLGKADEGAAAGPAGPGAGHRVKVYPTPASLEPAGPAGAAGSES